MLARARRRQALARAATAAAVGAATGAAAGLIVTLFIAAPWSAAASAAAGACAGALAGAAAGGLRRVDDLGILRRLDRAVAGHDLLLTAATLPDAEAPWARTVIALADRACADADPRLGARPWATRRAAVACLAVAASLVAGAILDADRGSGRSALSGGLAAAHNIGSTASRLAGRDAVARARPDAGPSTRLDAEPSVAEAEPGAADAAGEGGAAETTERGARRPSGALRPPRAADGDATVSKERSTVGAAGAEESTGAGDAAFAAFAAGEGPGAQARAAAAPDVASGSRREDAWMAALRRNVPDAYREVARRYAAP